MLKLASPLLSGLLLHRRVHISDRGAARWYNGERARIEWGRSWVPGDLLSCQNQRPKKIIILAMSPLLNRQYLGIRAKSCWLGVGKCVRVERYVYPWTVVSVIYSTIKIHRSILDLVQNIYHHHHHQGSCEVLSSRLCVRRLFHLWGPSQFPTLTTGGRWKCV